jgi:RNA polymerase sigma factor (sigma-70 family)
MKCILYKNIVKIVGCNRDDVECVTDSTMLCVYLNIDKFDINKSSFCTWVHTIARNVAINYIERSGHKNNNVYSTDFSDLYDSSIMVDDQDSYTEENCSPSYINNDDSFIDIIYDNGVYKVYTIEDVIADFFSVINSCIENLPSLKRDTFVERFINNRTIKDTAQLLGVSNTSVKRYYQDGMLNVVRCIKRDHPELYEMMKDLY